MPRPSSSFSRYLVPRLPWLGLVALGSVFFFSEAPVPASNDVAGLRGSLSRASDRTVTNIAWEPSRGAVLDFALGRGILFRTVRRGASQAEQQSGKQDPAAQHPAKGHGELHRAFVRLLPNGQMLTVSRERNLSDTELASESAPIVHGNVAVFATVFAGEPGSLTLLDLAGAPTSEDAGLLGRLQLAAERYLRTGSLSGLGRTDVTLPQKTSRVRARLEGDKLLVELDEDSFDVPLRVMNQNVDLDAPVAVNRRVAEPEPFLHWAADTGRRFVGNDAIAWLEGRVFGTLDQLQRLGHSVVEEEPAKTERPRPLEIQTGVQGSVWPPPQVPPRFETAKPGEGEWTPIENEFLAKQDFGPGPSPMARTFVRPDPERPYTKLLLVAMDMRRLILGMRAGYEDPHPETGPPGSGHVPPDPAVYQRIVATFNGAFKATHGSYGMKVEGRVLVPAKDGAATVVVDEQERVGLGTWNRPAADSTAHRQPPSPPSYRQNMDPLLDGDRINPAGREVWGDQLYGRGVAAERSALCVTQGGHLIYGWSTQITGESLAEGLSQAGCVYAMHLDMNPGHCSFLFNHVDSFDPLEAQGEVLHPAMKVNTTRYIRWSPKDFFYVASRRKLPVQQPGQPQVRWRVGPGTQPEPESVPALFRGTANLGQLELDIFRAELNRLDAVVVPGHREPGVTTLESGQPPNDAMTTADAEAQPGSKPTDLSPQSATRALVVLGLGHATSGSRPGLLVDRTKYLPFDRSYASLLLDEGAQPRLVPPGEAPPARQGRSIVQLPVLARDGELTEAGRKLGGMKKQQAMCLHDSGHLLTGRVEHDTPAPLVRTLVDMGCNLVVGMDRGSHSPALFERAGTKTPPHEGHPQTALYLLAAAMDPGAYRF